MRKSGPKLIEAPSCLEGIDSVYHMTPNIMSMRSGIYFLFLKGELQYVGQSEHILLRIGQHMKEGTKEFDDIYFILYDKYKLLEMERYYIKLYKPPLNRENFIRGQDNSKRKPNPTFKLKNSKTRRSICGG